MQINWKELERGSHLIFFYSEKDNETTYGITVEDIAEFYPDVYIITSTTGNHYWTDMMSEINLNVYAGKLS